MKEKNRKIILEDGTEYLGYGFGCMEDKKLELVFNTSMVGYQEILSDPSYTDQAVVMTYPLMGNYGINPDDFETEVPGIGALITRYYNNEPSNFRCSMTLGNYMEKYGICGISDVDTREITRKIRDYGSCKVLICSPDISTEQGVEILSAWQYSHDQVSRASGKSIRMSSSAASSDAPGNGLNIVAVDTGMKLNIVRELNSLGCNVTVVPWNTSADEIKKINPDGILLSNGPGDPSDVPETVNTVKALHGFCPIMGICLGHQILALSYGAKTYKLKFGHRGGNHPVKNLIKDTIEITSQNHSFAVEEASLEGTGLEITHINMLDNTVEGIMHRADKAFSIQYHPESAPGPVDSEYLFKQFIDVIKGGEIYA